VLVSCIMPTCNRQSLISVALKCYASQDWPDKELVVIDDGAVKVGGLVKQLVPDAVYIYLAEKQTIGAKRNLACEAAVSHRYLLKASQDGYDQDVNQSASLLLRSLSLSKYEVVLEQRQHHAALVTSRNDPQTNRKRNL
jgi:glycosyltransferase involved in cell wall biosynthesis